MLFEPMLFEPMRQNFCLLLLLVLFSGKVSAEKPNIILIFSDDHGYSDLGSQRIHDDVRTPHLDALANGGVRFTNGYVSAPQCVPSRAGLLTGIYQNRFGVEANKYPLEGFNKAQTIAERLKKVGYTTGMTGKWHLGAAPEIPSHGFDWVYYKNSNRAGWSNFDLTGSGKKPGPENSKLYHLDANSQAACAFIEKNHDRPFFFYCAYRAPHVPLDAPEKYLRRFKQDMPNRRRQALAMISAMDDGVGKIVSTLKRYQLEEKTLVFFLGDNGAPLKIHKIDAPGGGPGWDGSLNDPLNGEKGMLSEGGIRIPFVASWKGKIPAGQVLDNPVISLDIAATVNQLAGLPADATLDGVDLMPRLTKSQGTIPERKIFWRWISQSAIRKGDWKYLKGGRYEYLFNLRDDPGETTNLIKSKPDIAQSLKNDLSSWSQELKPPGIDHQQQTAVWNRYFEHYLEGNLEPRPEKLTNGASESIDGWLCRNGSLKKRDGVLTVTSTSANQPKSFLVRNGIQLAPGSSIEIKVKTSSSGKIGASWRMAGQKDFNDKQVTFQTVAASKEPQTINLKLNARKQIIHLRILLPHASSEIDGIRFLDDQNRTVQHWKFDE